MRNRACQITRCIISIKTINFIVSRKIVSDFVSMLYLAWVTNNVCCCSLKNDPRIRRNNVFHELYDDSLGTDERNWLLRDIGILRTLNQATLREFIDAVNFPSGIGSFSPHTWPQAPQYLRDRTTQLFKISLFSWYIYNATFLNCHHLKSKQSLLFYGFIMTG